MENLEIKMSRILDTDYSLKRKVISRNSKNCYISTSISSCNTSRKDGLFVCKDTNFSNSYQVLLSHVDEVLMSNACYYQLGFHQYPNSFFPEGLKYILNVEQEPHIAFSYAMGNILLKKELFLSPNKVELTCKYTLEESYSEIDMVLKPLLAFRNIHSLNKKEDKNFNVKFKKNTIKISESKNYPDLYFNFSKQIIFTESKDWYNNFEYNEDKQAGKQYKEDLFLPGQIIVSLKEKESFSMTISLENIKNYEKEKIKEKINKKIKISNVKHLLT